MDNTHMSTQNTLKKIGICAHSYEGGALCFLSTCRAGAQLLGPHMHPPVVMSAIPMGWSMPAWESDNFQEVGQYLRQGVEEVAHMGADFFICPDNTAHLVLEQLADDLPIAGLHIADVVCQEIQRKGWKNVGLLGTNWTMTGIVYAEAIERNGLIRMIPDTADRNSIHTAIFEELCQGVFRQQTIGHFIDTIERLKEKGAECVILGCTEIPLIITEDNSPLPILDSTRLLARYAVQLAISDQTLPSSGWINVL